MACESIGGVRRQQRQQRIQPSCLPPFEPLDPIRIGIFVYYAIHNETNSQQNQIFLSQSQQFFETPPPVYDMPPNYNDINSINI
jgi:hypothetical protein